jgi:hypothetical protein
MKTKLVFVSVSVAVAAVCAASGGVAAETARFSAAGFGTAEFADGEAVAFHALPAPSGKNWRMTLWPGSAGISNRVEAAFGTDIDGDGALSPAEVSAVIGFERGEWFVLGGRGLENRWAAAAAGGALVLDVRLSANGAARGVSFRDGGGNAVSFAGLPPSAAWLSPSARGAARVSARGAGGGGERLFISSFPDGTAVIVK